MSGQLVGVRWNTDDGMHVELTETELVCVEDDTFIDEGLLDDIRRALIAGNTVFVIFEPEEYFTREDLPALEDLEIDGLRVIGIGDSSGDLVDTEEDECGIECDYLIVVLEGESGTIEFDDVQGTFLANGEVEFIDFDDDEDDEDDDDEDDEDDDDEDDEDDDLN